MSRCGQTSLDMCKKYSELKAKLLLPKSWYTTKVLTRLHQADNRNETVPFVIRLGVMESTTGELCAGVGC